MAHIESYKLIYAPNGNGRILYKIVGNPSVQSTEVLTVQVFTALAILLAQKQLEVNAGVFSSFDTNVNLAQNLTDEDAA